MKKLQYYPIFQHSKVQKKNWISDLTHNMTFLAVIGGCGMPTEVGLREEDSDVVQDRKLL